MKPRNVKYVSWTRMFMGNDFYGRKSVLYLQDSPRLDFGPNISLLLTLLLTGSKGQGVREIIGLS